MGLLKLPHVLNMAIIRIFIVGRTGLKKARRYGHGKNGGEIVVIPMAHLEKQTYYDEIKEYLDTKKSEGYKVFYEGIEMPGDMESSENDLLARKFRKVMGFYLTDYKNSLNRSIPKAIRQNKYTSQTKEILGITTENDIHADLTLGELIAAYEKEKGEIAMTGYDLSTGLFEEYKYDNKVKYDYKFMIKDLRERHLCHVIEHSGHDKSIVLYGKAHLKGLDREFRESGYERLE